MASYKLINFKVLGDERGSLISLEGNKNVPFEIKRVYYIFGTKEGVVRGRHAHRTLKQVVVAVRGSCDFVLDDGRKKECIKLEDPSVGLYIEDMIWHEMQNFSEDCVLVVLASDYYDEKDYVRDYEEFLKECVHAK